MDTSPHILLERGLRKDEKHERNVMHKLYFLNNGQNNHNNYDFIALTFARCTGSSVLGNSLQTGDHVPWNIPLDCTHSRLNFHSNSNIRHILLAEDPQLTRTQSSLGTLNFVQVGYKD